MTSVIVRICIRYAAGALVIKGFIPEQIGNQIAADADILNVLEVVTGIGLGALAEGWYWLARRFGWAK